MENRNIIAAVILLLVVGAIVWITVTLNSDQAQNFRPILTVSSFNQSKGVDATSISANAGDILEFTLKASNPYDSQISNYALEVNLTDITGDAILLDAGGANYNSENNSLVWPAQNIPAGQVLEKKFTVRANQVTADTILKVRLDDSEANIALAAPVIAGAENPTPSSQPETGFQAPTTGPSEMVLLGLALLATIGYFGFKFRKKLL